MLKKIESIKEELKKIKTASTDIKTKTIEHKQNLEHLNKKQKKIVEGMKSSKEKLLIVHIKYSILYLPYLILILDTHKIIELMLLIFSVVHILIHLDLIRSKHKIVKNKIEADMVTESMIYSFIQVVIIFGILIFDTLFNRKRRIRIC